jgi:hypothetical protein
MDLKGILSIGGYSGLYKLIKQTKNGFVVESLTDKKRMQAFASSKISTLEDIAIYTETGEVSLKDVFKKIFEKENGKKTISHKSSAEELKNLFAEVLPDYDRDRVYVSDIKKVINWYNQLVELNLIDLKEDEEEKDDEEKKNETGNTEDEENTQEKDSTPKDKK